MPAHASPRTSTARARAHRPRADARRGAPLPAACSRCPGGPVGDVARRARHRPRRACRPGSAGLLDARHRQRRRRAGSTCSPIPALVGPPGRGAGGRGAAAVRERLLELAAAMPVPGRRGDPARPRARSTTSTPIDGELSSGGNALALLDRPDRRRARATCCGCARTLADAPRGRRSRWSSASRRLGPPVPGDLSGPGAARGARGAAGAGRRGRAGPGASPSCPPGCWSIRRHPRGAARAARLRRRAAAAGPPAAPSSRR